MSEALKGLYVKNIKSGHTKFQNEVLSGILWVEGRGLEYGHGVWGRDGGLCTVMGFVYVYGYGVCVCMGMGVCVCVWVWGFGFVYEYQ